MKRILFTVMLFVSMLPSRAQKHISTEMIRSDVAVNIASPNVRKNFVAPPENINRLKSADVATAEIDVTYIDFPEKAKRAFEYAVSIWESQVHSEIPIKILASWGSVEGDLLASGRPSTFHMNFDGAPLQDVYYPVSLAEKLTGKQINSGETDIVCSFNSRFAWYFELDGNTPVNQYDFVTAVMHEIAHGLGFSGFFKDNGESGFFNNGNNLPSIYDWLIFNKNQQQLADNSVFYRPSFELHKQLTSDQLNVSQPNVNSTVRSICKVHAPMEWKDGSSIYHLESGNGLMNVSAEKGLAVHNPGDEIIEILSAMGWESVSFEFDKLKDFEIPCAELPVNLGIVSDFELVNPSVKLMFSTDNFMTSDSIILHLDKSTNQYSGSIPLNYFSGTMYYYIVLKTNKDKVYKLPSVAPNKVLSLKIGPDYFPPSLLHNPVKLISSADKELKFKALATDNFGIKSVAIEYKLNGILQAPVFMTQVDSDQYFGKLGIPDEILKSNTFEYRIIAKDKSAVGNTKILPSSGFYAVSYFYAGEPLESYFTDFEKNFDDFVTADFSISRVAGFTGNILHTRHPYPVSALEDEKHNLIAQLRYPVILQEDGQMSFDEVVLVEPGEPGITYLEEYFWDFVIVEGSKDNGLTWNPLVSGYDSNVFENWATEFENTIINNCAQATGNQSMFQRKIINLTKNTGFFAGDKVLFRFRLASDFSVNGWGWAIDNLDIQKSITTDAKLVIQNQIKTYPNPFTDKIFIEFARVEGNEPVNVSIADMFGKTVFRQVINGEYYQSKIAMDLTGIRSGMYIIKLSKGNSSVFTQRIIKN